MKILKTLTIILLPLTAIAQSPADTISLADLSPISYNYKKCVVTITAGKWTKENGKDILPVTATITNTANDTLEYEIRDFRVLNYPANKDGLQFDTGNGQAVDVLYHIPISILAPQQHANLAINLIKAKGTSDSHGKFRICILLIIDRPHELGIGYILNVKDGSILKLPDADIKNRSHWLRSNVLKI